MEAIYEHWFLTTAWLSMILGTWVFVRLTSDQNIRDLAAAKRDIEKE